MRNEELQQIITAFDFGAEFSNEAGFLNVTISSTVLTNLVQRLRNEDELQFDYLFCLTGVDWPDHMSVVYHFKSTTHQHCLVVKAIINSREKPEIDTVCTIWRTAEFHEREIYDLFGIRFNNHPDLRRIFLEDDWEGWPLRKDYVDEINIVEL